MPKTKPYRIAVIALSGKPTQKLSDAFENAIIPKISEFDALILLIENVCFSNDHGIGELIRAFKACKDKDGVFALVKPNERTEQFFKICRLYSIFDIYETEEEALGLCPAHPKKEIKRFKINCGDSTPASYGGAYGWPSLSPITVSVPLQALLDLRDALKSGRSKTHYSIPITVIDTLLGPLRKR